jgi:hypothetical protein
MDTQIGFDEYLTPKEAMKVLRCKSYTTLWKRLDKLGIKYIVLNKRVTLIPKESIYEALKNKQNQV